MLPELELVYWPIRGRAYPVLLMLKAARVPFTYTEREFDAEAHHGAKQRSETDLDDLPFGALPVLKVKGGGGEAVIAETSAILRYVEKVVGDEFSVNPSKQLAPVDQARVDMVHSAALFNSTVLYNSAGASPQWLEGDRRTKLERERILPFLRCLEHQLAHPAFPREAALQPRPLRTGGELFSAAACAVAYTLSMVCDLFPYSLTHPLAKERPEDGVHGTLEEQFPACAAVLRGVEGSVGVTEWVASGARKERWSNWPSYTPDQVRRAAKAAR